MPLAVGSLCSGTGAIEMALSDCVGGEVAWHVEADPHASAVLARHWPEVPNLGDITEVDWHWVAPVDVLIAGFPCQDISHAGRRIGISGRRSGLWQYVASAICVLRPRLVFLENVAAIRVRGLDAVIGDLAAIGYDARWTCLRASDVGAPHARDRWFCLAYPADAQPDRGRWDRWPGHLPEARGWHEPAHPGHPTAVAVSLLPTPAARDWKSGASNLMERNSRPLNEFAVNKLADIRLPDGQWVTADGVDFSPAIRRWETILGRPAPCPTEAGVRNNRRLAAPFAEWMMGLPAGHVTDVGIPRKDQLRILGAGCVPHQAQAAFDLLCRAEQQLVSAS